MLKIYTYLLFFFLPAVIISSCKKNTDEHVIPDPNVTACSYQLHEMWVDGLSQTLTFDTAYNMPQSYFSIHQVDAGNGVTYNFGTAQVPSAKKYTITSQYGSVNQQSGNVYVEFFKNGAVYIAQARYVYVANENGQITVEMCKIKCKNSFDENYTVSLKSILPLL